ncbi:MAG: PilZ domain-containing protein [Planctomycetaceae bacterium]|nr:PilZ domain-containing protein [Planctomycetaceae bacterium]
MSDESALQFEQHRANLPVRSDVHLSACLDENLPLPAQLIEFSHRDIHFLTDRPLRFGTRIHLAVFLDLVSSVARNVAVVHWCRAGRHGWEIGAFLTHPLSERILNQSVDNYRTHLRYSCNYRGWLRCDPGGELVAVRILDYSMSGMKLQTSQPLLPGTNFCLFVHSSGANETPLRGQIHWSRRIDDHNYAIGCNIERLKGLQVPRLFAGQTELHAEVQSREIEAQTLETLENLREELSQMEEFLPTSDEIVRFS